MSLEQEPFSEPLHNSAKHLLLNRGGSVPGDEIAKEQCKPRGHRRSTRICDRPRAGSVFGSEGLLGPVYFFSQKRFLPPGRKFAPVCLGGDGLHSQTRATLEVDTHLHSGQAGARRTDGSMCRPCERETSSCLGAIGALGVVEAVEANDDTAIELQRQGRSIRDDRNKMRHPHIRATLGFAR